MTTRTLAAALFKALPIPYFARRNLYVERALQERRAAATALECIAAHALCLEEEIEKLAGGCDESRRILASMNDLIADIRRSTLYDEVELEHAIDEI